MPEPGLWLSEPALPDSSEWKAGPGNNNGININDNVCNKNQEKNDEHPDIFKI